jgi:hypothetical protein
MPASKKYLVSNHNNRTFQKIVSMITKELDTLARNAIKEELKLIDPLSSLGKISPIDIDWDNNNKMSPVDIS